MSKYLISVFCMILFFSCSTDLEQSNKNINVQQISDKSTIVSKDSLKLRPVEGLFYYKSKPFTGTSIQKVNDVLVESTQYLNGKKHGELKKWYNSELLSYETSYKNGKQNGIAKTWWRNGVLRSQSNFKNGIADGLQQQWYKSGAKFKKVQLVDGKEEGLQQSWRENGKIYNNYEAKNGRIFGLKRANLCYELEDEIVQYKD